MGSLRFWKYCREPDARSENIIISFGCLLSSAFIICSSRPFTMLTENLRSRRLKVFIRIEAEVMPSVSKCEIILMGFPFECSRNCLVILSISSFI